MKGGVCKRYTVRDALQLKAVGARYIYIYKTEFSHDVSALFYFIKIRCGCVYIKGGCRGQRVCALPFQPKGNYSFVIPTQATWRSASQLPCTNETTDKPCN